MRPAGLVAIASWLCCATAQAQVFEVGDGGTLQRIDPVPASKPPLAVKVVAGDVGQSTAPEVPARFRDAVQVAAQRYELSPWLLDALARSESGYRADVVSSAGAIGVMQLMPGTARELGVDPRDPVQNILGGAAYLRRMLDRFDGNLDLALAAYNAGSGSVDRHGGVPPFRETRDYVQRNLERLASATDAGALAATPPAWSSNRPPTGGTP